MNSTRRDVLALVLRVFLAGVLLLAGSLKLSSGPLLFLQDIRGFGFFPEPIAVFGAYYMPWLEVILGCALLLGTFTREAATISALTLSMFSVALAVVLFQGKQIDCGCFGGLFGEGAVSWWSVLRNMTFIAIAVAVVTLGGGRWALVRD